MSKTIGIIRYPGSNCDFDMKRYFDDSFFIWHKETEYPEGMTCLVIPGGFAFGDRLYHEATGKYTISPGTMAMQSPVTKIILEAAKRKTPILGICNGFQILVQLGLLPGQLLINKNEKFTCKEVACYLKYKTKQNNVFDKQFGLTIANSFGRYKISYEEYEKMDANHQLFLRYLNTDEVLNIGSMENIAGVCNEEHTIFGMMPHPERGNNEFKSSLEKILFPKPINNNDDFDSKITHLLHSEHISYKSTRQYLKTLHTQEPWVIQGPGENAGIIDIGGGYALAMRIESHNHPTFINPFEGAATGVGGILRDVIAMGARPIGILDFLRFGTDEHSKTLLNKTIEGISYYGNCFGVANVGGDLYNSPCFNKNPLVNIACLGIVKKEHIIYGNAKEAGDLLIYVGSKTGKEGIGGAAMASQSFTSEIDINKMNSTIQKSDPFLEKLLLEACCEIAEEKLAVGMQDLGAGGLLCATYEVVHRAREKTGYKLGCKIELENIPTKCEMKSYEILVSESQERMLIVCKNENKDKIFSIFEKWDLEYSTIGKVDMSGDYAVYRDDEMLLKKQMEQFDTITQDWELLKMEPKQSKPVKYKDKSLWEVYDGSIGNRTIKGYNKDGGYSVLDLYEVGKQLYITWGNSFDDCYQQLMNMKVKPLAIVNCLNYGHPGTALGDLVKTVEELTQKGKEKNIPVIGGNVSLYNSTDGVDIFPSPVIVMVGLL